MRKSTIRNLLLIACLAFSSLIVQAQDKPREKPAGLEPYIPTKIEWLALDLNANCPYHDSAGGFTITYTVSGGETITLLVIYSADVNKAAMKVAVEASRQALKIAAEKVYKWNWVKIKEKYQPLTEPEK